MSSNVTKAPPKPKPAPNPKPPAPVWFTDWAAI